MTWTPRLIYRILHHTRVRDGGKLTDLVASAAARLEASVGEITHDLATAKCFTASLMVENSRISAGIQAWYQLAALDNPRGEMKRAQVRSLSRLAAVCLYHPEIPFCDEPPLRLDEKAEYSDICLAISSWLRYHSDLINAWIALRGRVKKSIELLSDDDPSNDDDAFLSLFQTFLAAADSNEDLSRALYLTKAWYRDYLREAKKDHPISEGGVAESLNQVHLVDDETQVPDDEVSERRISYSINYFAECSNCKCGMTSICHWYFCCCCPFMMLCQWCYRDIKSALSQDGASHPPGICDPRHEFYYTSGPLQAFERVPEGMMVLDGLDGKRRTAWIEEWKDQLSEKWETADFAFEGGLSAWCMRVLPEPQRSRWARFFRCD